MWLNCKVIKKWQLPSSGLFPVSSKILYPSSDSIFGRSYSPLIRGVFQLCKLWHPDLWPWAHLYLKKAQIEEKVIIVFIDTWKEIGSWFWLIWIAWWLNFFLEYIYSVWFWPSSGIQTLDPSCKNLIFPKNLEWHLYNYEDYLWSKFQLNLTLFTGVITPSPPTSPHPPKKTQNGPEPNWVLNQKKGSCFFLIKFRTANTHKMKLGI